MIGLLVSTNICLFSWFLVFGFVQQTYPILLPTGWQCVRACAFELCHPPKQFIPKTKIYKNDCCQTSCAFFFFFLCLNRKECVFSLNSMPFHHHFASCQFIYLYKSFVRIFRSNEAEEKKNIYIQNDASSIAQKYTKYYTIDEKDRKRREKWSIPMYNFCGIACGVPNHRWHHRIQNRTIQKALLPIFNGPFLFFLISFIHSPFLCHSRYTQWPQPALPQTNNFR